MSDRDTFWLVWNPSGSNPRSRHSHYESAEQEALRLSRANPGVRFYVLRAESFHERVDVRTVHLTMRRDQEPPF